MHFTRQSFIDSNFNFVRT
uniref:Uncharacterized protein n=1 Tax=Arundo donax TaxID=35708 RepID=A0A0A8ZQM0_ARUDO